MKVLITGSSTGFGKLIAETLLKDGHEVAATMRGVDGKNKASAQALTKAGAKVVGLDVTDDASVERGVLASISALGGLDAIINNAGFSYLGLQETFTPEDWKKTFDVNVYGVQRVTKATIPHLRKQGSGLFIHISSTVGRVALPFFGAYIASKWALEALAEVYRLELARDGIETIIVEPGGFATDFFNKVQASSDAKRAEEIGDFANAPREFVEGFGKILEQNPQQQPQDVADAVLKLINTPAGERPFRTVVDKLGVADAIAPQNEAHLRMTDGVHQAFGLGDMAKLKVPAAH